MQVLFSLFYFNDWDVPPIIQALKFYSILKSQLYRIINLCLLPNERWPNIHYCFALLQPCCRKRLICRVKHLCEVQFLRPQRLSTFYSDVFCGPVSVDVQSGELHAETTIGIADLPPSTPRSVSFGEVKFSRAGARQGIKYFRPMMPSPDSHCIWSSCGHW